MLLKPITSESLILKLKLKYFAYQQCLLNSKDQHTNLLTFLLEMLYFLPTVSILFKYSTFQQPLLNKFFSFFILSQFHTHFDVSQVLTIVLMSLFGIGFFITFLYTYNTQKSNSFSSRLYVNLLSMVIYFNVPYNQLHFTILFKNYTQSPFIVGQIIAGISILICTLTAVMFLKLKIKPLRKDNSSWNISNQYELNRFFLNFTRVFVFINDGFNFISILISTVLEYVIRIRISKYYKKQYLQQIQTSSNLVIATHIGFLIFQITGNQEFSTKILFSLWLIFFFKGIYGHYNQVNKIIQFPLCQSTPYEFYNFYYELCAKYEEKVPMQYESNENFYFSTLKQHSRRCKSPQCPLLGICLKKKNIVNQVQNFVSQILRKNRNLNPNYQVLEQIWKLQRGKKFSFRDKSNDMDLQTEYIIFTIDNSEIGRSDYQIDTFNHQSSPHVLNNIFLEQLFSMLQCFSEFYSQILKSKPKLQIITTIGQQIRKKGEQVQDLYMDLLKRKAINFKAIQLFIEFQTYFLKMNSLNYDLLKKIMSIQRNLTIDDIEQIYLSSFTVYADTNLIENANMECINFLKCTRFQLKTKFIEDIIAPQFKFEKYFNLTEQQIQNSLMFIRKKHGEYVCGNIKINTKFTNNKKFYVCIFEKKKRTQGTNFILLNNKFQIISLAIESEILKQKRHPQIMVNIKWREIFQTHVKRSQKQLRITKLIKIDLKEYDSILMCSLNKTFNEQFDILSLKIMRNLKDTTTQRRSVIMRSAQKLGQSDFRKFQFIYDLNDQNAAVMRGYRKDTTKVRQLVRKTTHMDKFALDIRSNLVDFTIIKSRNLNLGIKTYRLYGLDLYNIDLQDKEAYIQQFQGRRHHSDHNQRDIKRPIDIYIIALVIGVSLVLAGLSIYLLYSLNFDMNQIKEDFKISNQIDRFKINFYQILSMLRDVASGLYQQLQKDWITNVMQSYNIIRDDHNKKMFSNEELAMTYSEYNYTGNLNQLVEVILSDVFMLTQNFDAPIIEQIHDTAILQISDMIQNQQDIISDRIASNLNDFRTLKNWVGFGIITGIILFYILMVYLCCNLVVTIKHNLHDLLLISDNQSKQSQQNAQKLIYAIDMTRKNFQIDVKNLIVAKKKYRKRRKQKTTIIGSSLKFITFAAVVLFCVANILIILMFNLILQSNFSDFQLMKAHGQSILASYSDLCKQTNTIEHTGTVNLQKVIELRSQLVNFQKSITSLIFSQQTNKNIIDYFLNDSCQKLIDNGYLTGDKDQQPCQRSTPGYQIQNPFVLGLQLYLTRAHYNILQNITDTYASTGIYSSLFSKVFSQLSREISADGQAKIQQFIFSAGLYSLFLIIINIVYCVIAILLSLYVKKKNESVQKLIKFLNLKGQNQTKHSIKPKQKVSSEKSIESSPATTRRAKPKRLSVLQNGQD